MAQELRSRVNPEDVEVAKDFVEGQFQLFYNGLSGVVQKACAENDLREQWLSTHYFSTLKDFSTRVKNAYVPHVSQDAVRDDGWKRAEELHKELAHQDEEPVQLLMANKVSAHYEK